MRKTQKFLEWISEVRIRSLHRQPEHPSHLLMMRTSVCHLLIGNPHLAARAGVPGNLTVALSSRYEILLAWAPTEKLLEQRRACNTPRL